MRVRLTHTEASLLLSAFAVREPFCCARESDDTASRNLLNFKRPLRRVIERMVYDHAGCDPTAGEWIMERWISKLAWVL